MTARGAGPGELAWPSGLSATGAPCRGHAGPGALVAVRGVGRERVDRTGSAYDERRSPPTAERTSIPLRAGALVLLPRTRSLAVAIRNRWADALSALHTG